MKQMCGYLVGNIVVAMNLQRARDAEITEAKYDQQWNALAKRACAIGCRLQRCYLDPECDGIQCGCGPGLRDRDGNPVGDLASDEPSQNWGMLELLIAQLEANDGIRP